MSDVSDVHPGGLPSLVEEMAFSFIIIIIILQFRTNFL